jgi:SAM-dependent methyltransferase
MLSLNCWFDLAVMIALEARAAQNVWLETDRGNPLMALDSLKSFANRLDLKERVRACEDWWFDTTRRVQTSGLVAVPEASKVVGEIRDSYIYGAVRVANAHVALRDLPLSDYSQYTFVDMGSGKGRMLFVAAEYPFRKVIGVEFSNDLHEEALANIKRYKYSGQRCADIESVHGDAAEFEFPNERLVLYMFNPFGPEVMGRMLANLERSIERHRRHVIVLMLWPEHAGLVAQMRGMQVYRQTRRHHIYQAGDQAGDQAEDLTGDL